MKRKPELQHRWKVGGLGLLLVLAANARTQTGVHADPKPGISFDVVSIRLDESGEERGKIETAAGGDRLVVTNAPMYRILQFAFDFQKNDLIVGAPGWTYSERWDIEAKVAPADLPAYRALSFTQQRAMLQSVLAERCNLQAYAGKKEVPVYALVVAKGGIKMHEVLPAEEQLRHPIPGEWDVESKHGEIRGRDVPVPALLYALTGVSLDRQVVDQTGLKGKYDFDLLWTPDEDADFEPRADAAGSIFSAIQQEMGLRLERTHALVDALIIDHIERPTKN